jgi:hypothetical protein
LYISVNRRIVPSKEDAAMNTPDTCAVPDHALDPDGSTLQANQVAQPDLPSQASSPIDWRRMHDDYHLFAAGHA